MFFYTFAFLVLSTVGKIISKKELADLIGKSERWVSKLIDEGLPIAGGGGRGVAVQIDSAAAIEWMIAREVRREIGVDGDDDEGAGSASSEDRLLKRARREKLQIEIDKERGRLVPNDAVMTLCTSIAAVYATQLDSLASRCASDLAVLDEPAEIRARLFEETRRIRAATADRLVDRARKLTTEADGLDSLRRGDGEGAAAEDV